MLVDQSPLLIAIGLCGAAMAIAMGMIWLTSRTDRFLAVWAGGTGLISAGAVLYSLLPIDNIPMMALAFGLETLGVISILVAALQFSRRPITAALPAAAVFLLLVVLVPFAFGLNGLGIMNFNFVAAGVLGANALVFWAAREEAPTSIVGMTAMYGLAALSFFACGVAIGLSGQMAMSARPSNLAEDINIIVVIIGVTAIGALSLSLSQARMARRHERAALTDTLTGLMNRRALFGHAEKSGLAPGQALIAFDLDNFKAVNDVNGHAAGDDVLRAFAHTLRQHMRAGDMAARIGGEEFVLLLAPIELPDAMAVAERIRASFAAAPIATLCGPVSASTSAGIALVRREEKGLDPVLRRADLALYKAKAGGRNRIVTELVAVA